MSGNSASCAGTEDTQSASSPRIRPVTPSIVSPVLKTSTSMSPVDPDDRFRDGWPARCACAATAPGRRARAGLPSRPSPDGGAVQVAAGPPSPAGTGSCRAPHAATPISMTSTGATGSCQRSASTSRLTRTSSPGFSWPSRTLTKSPGLRGSLVANSIVAAASPASCSGMYSAGTSRRREDRGEHRAQQLVLVAVLGGPRRHEVIEVDHRQRRSSGRVGRRSSVAVALSGSLAQNASHPREEVHRRLGDGLSPCLVGCHERHVDGLLGKRNLGAQVVLECLIDELNHERHSPWSTGTRFTSRGAPSSVGTSATARAAGRKVHGVRHVGMGNRRRHRAHFVCAVITGAFRRLSPEERK